MDYIPKPRPVPFPPPPYTGRDTVCLLYLIPWECWKVDIEFCDLLNKRYVQPENVFKAYFEEFRRMWLQYAQSPDLYARHRIIETHFCPVC